MSDSSVAADAAGGLYLTGYLGSGADFGGGLVATGSPENVFLASLDAVGRHRASRAMPFDDLVLPVIVAADAGGNSVLTGGVIGGIDLGGGPLTLPSGKNAFVARYGSDGSHIWSSLYGGDSSWVTGDALALDDAGNTYVGLSVIGEPPEFLVKYDPAGRSMWTKTPCDFIDCFLIPEAISVADGRIVMIGNYSGAPDFGNGPLVEAQGDMGIFVAAFTLDGTPVWSRGFDSLGFDMGTAVVTDEAGNVFIAGGIAGTVDFGDGPLASNGELDIALVKLDPTGATMWSKSWGGATADLGKHLTIDPLGNVALCGYLSPPVDFGGGAIGTDDASTFVATFDTDGGHVWSRAFPVWLEGMVGVPSASEVVFAGHFEGEVDLGTGPLTSAGGGDLVVFALSP